MSAQAIVAVTLAGACLPYWLKRRAAGRHGSQAVLAISHSLAGGVFVTAALLRRSGVIVPAVPSKP